MQNNFMSQIWFSPNFALNNPKNTTGNFTWLNYVCEQYMQYSDENEIDEIFSEVSLYSGPKDLNLPSKDF
jgi:hypothetical protein